MKIDLDSSLYNRLLIGKEWVSDGHWMIHKSLLKSEKLFDAEHELICEVLNCPIGKLTDKQIENVLDLSDLNKYKETKWICKTGQDSRLFKGESDYLFLDERFYLGLGMPHVIYAKNGKSPTFNNMEAPTIVIMPRYHHDPGSDPQIIQDIFIEISEIK